MNLQLIFVSAVFIVSGCIIEAANWSYQNQDSWPGSCNGDEQSPIDIKTQSVKMKKMNPLQFIDYNAEYEIEVVNNGHAVQVTLSNPQQIPKLSGGGLESNYSLTNFHFHWESEHTIDGKHYPLETHFVHFAEQYGNFNNALKHPDGLAVVGVFSDASSANKAIKVILNAIPDIKKSVNKKEKLQQKITLKDLLPTDLNDFYFYAGSLTTPDCNQVVFWTVLKNPAKISKQQLDDLTNVDDAHNKRLTYNYRNTQPLNGREVYANKNN